MKANGNEGCRSLLTSLWGVRTCEQVHAHASRATLLTLPCSETHLPAHLDLGMHVPEAGHLCSAHPSLTPPARGDGGGIWAVRSPRRSKDLPKREAVTGLKLVFLKLAGDFLQYRDLAGFLRHLGA